MDEQDYIEGTTEQLQALVSPVRNRVYRQMQAISPCSVTDIAKSLGMQATTVHYHVQYLVRVGLVKMTGKRSIGPRSEAVFEASKKRFLLKDKSESAKHKDVMVKSMTAFMRASQRDFERAMRKGDREQLAHFARLTGKLTPEVFQKVVDLLWEAESEMKEEGDGHRYSLTLALVPLD